MVKNLITEIINYARDATTILILIVTSLVLLKSYKELKKLSIELKKLSLEHLKLKEEFEKQKMSIYSVTNDDIKKYIIDPNKNKIDKVYFTHCLYIFISKFLNEQKNLDIQNENNHEQLECRVEIKIEDN